MKKYYIRMNLGNYLSIGNIFLLIKDVSSSLIASQNEIFCSLFNIPFINNSTVNNYCIGIRAIGVEYKKIYLDLWDEYLKDRNVFKNILCSLLCLLDNKVYVSNNIDISFINNNSNLKKLCIKLYELSFNDKNIDNEYLSKIKKYYDDDDYYNMFIYCMYYAVILNKQPLYEQEMLVEINKDELNEYLKVKLYEGVSYINSLITLSKKNNMYAASEIGSMEYDGLIDGNHNYQKAYDYYMKAALKNHPKACWMISNMILNGKVEYDFNTLWKFLNKAIELGSSAALNTMGLCYLRGINDENKVDVDKAIEYFKLSSDRGYLFAFNNLGKIEEDKGNINEAYDYYKISADMGNSWALNKMGEYYRMNGDIEKALMYYKLADSAPISERCLWAKKNIERYNNGREDC